MVYIFVSVVALASALLTSVYNVTNIAINKCPDVKVMTTWMQITLAVIIFAFAANMMFMLGERFDFTFDGYSESWGGNGTFNAGYSIVLIVVAIFTMLCYEFVANESKRFVGICERMNVFELSKFNVRTKVNPVDSSETFYERLKFLYASSMEKYPKGATVTLAMKDVEEWSAISKYYSTIQADLIKITPAGGDKYADNNAFMKKDMFNQKNFNWLKANKVYQEINPIPAFHNHMFGTHECQAQRFVDMVKSKSTLFFEESAELQPDRVNAYIKEFALNEKDVDTNPYLKIETLVQNLKSLLVQPVMEDMLESTTEPTMTDTSTTEPTMTDTSTTMPTTDTADPTSMTLSGSAILTNIPTGVSMFTGLDFTQLAKNTLKSITNVGSFYDLKGDTGTCSDIKFTIIELPLNDMIAIKKSVVNMYTTLMTDIYTAERLTMYKDAAAKEDDYMRRNIIAGFTWSMIVWPSLQSHATIVQLYSALGSPESNLTWVWYVSSVLVPILLGIVLYGRGTIGTGIQLKDFTDIMKKGITPQVEVRSVRVHHPFKSEDVIKEGLDYSTYKVSELQALPEFSDISWDEYVFQISTNDVKLDNIESTLSEMGIGDGNILKIVKRK